MAMAAAELVDAHRHLDIEGAVFGDFPDFSLAPPLDGLQALGDFPEPERGQGHILQLDPVAEGFFDIQQQIQVHRARNQIHHGIAVQDLVIKPDVVEPHHQIRPDQLVDQGIGVVLAKNPVFPEPGAEGHANRHSHFSAVPPAADITGGSLGFQVKIHDVALRGVCHAAQ